MKQTIINDTRRAKKLTILLFLALLPSMAHAQCPDENHPHMIDLGLPGGVKWACCNVGANKPEEFGGYFAAGETEEKETYTEGTYKLKGRRDIYNYVKNTYGDRDYNKSSLLPEYDVAHVKWGDNWSMPTLLQFKVLWNRTTHKQTTVNGVKGWLFTGFNGNSIFFPAGGFHGNRGFECVEIMCYYWTASTWGGDDQHIFFKYSSDGYNFSKYGQYKGYNVRPVSK